MLRVDRRLVGRNEQLDVAAAVADHANQLLPAPYSIFTRNERPTRAVEHALEVVPAVFADRDLVGGRGRLCDASLPAGLGDRAQRRPVLLRPAGKRQRLIVRDSAETVLTVSRSHREDLAVDPCVRVDGLVAQRQPVDQESGRVVEEVPPVGKLRSGREAPVLERARANAGDDQRERRREEHDREGGEHEAQAIRMCDQKRK